MNSGFIRRKRLKKFGDKEKLDFKTCRLCLKHCSHYNETESLDFPAIMFDKLKDYGCTPLHNWMRSMELLLKAAEVKLARLENISRKQARLNIQARFSGREGRGLRVFYPKPGGGNSNTGPTARRFFQNSVITSRILDCPKESVNFKSISSNVIIVIKVTKEKILAIAWLMKGTNKSLID